MGLMDSLKQHAEGMGGDALISGVLSHFGGGNNGLMQIVNQFRQAGMGGAVNSWISNGQNENISPEHVEQALGSDKVQQLAEKFHISPDTLKSQLAQHLPGAVDKMTPNGQLPQENAA